MSGVSAGYPHGDHPHGHEELDASLAGGPKDVIQLHSPEELAHKSKVTLSFGIDNFRVAYLTLKLSRTEIARTATSSWKRPWPEGQRTSFNFTRQRNPHTKVKSLYPLGLITMK